MCTAMNTAATTRMIKTERRLNRRSATKWEILSLVGLLQHAAKVVRPSCTFVSRMYSVAAKVQKLDFYTRLNKGFRSDLYWWRTFLSEWNGVSLLHPSYPRHGGPD